MLTIKQLLEELEIYEKGLEFPENIQYNEDDNDKSEITQRKDYLKKNIKKINPRWIWVDEDEYAKICHAIRTYSFPEDEGSYIITRRTSEFAYIIEIMNKEENPEYYVLAKEAYTNETKS